MITFQKEKQTFFSQKTTDFCTGFDENVWVVSFTQTEFRLVTKTLRFSKTALMYKMHSNEFCFGTWRCALEFAYERVQTFVFSTDFQVC